MQSTSRSGSGFQSVPPRQSHHEGRTMDPNKSREGSKQPRGTSAPRGRSQTRRTHRHDSQSTPKLSDKERAERLAVGQCFICGNADHFSHDCPSKRTVQSSGSKPPGASTLSIEPTLEERESEDYVEVLDSLPLGVLAFGDLDPSQYEPSYKWMELTAPVLLGPVDSWQEDYLHWKEQGVWARR